MPKPKKKRNATAIRKEIDTVTQRRSEQNAILRRELTTKASGGRMGTKKTGAMRDRGEIVGRYNRRLRALRTELRSSQSPTRQKDR